MSVANSVPLLIRETFGRDESAVIEVLGGSSISSGGLEISEILSGARGGAIGGDRFSTMVEICPGEVIIGVGKIG